MGAGGSNSKLDRFSIRPDARATTAHFRKLADLHTHKAFVPFAPKQKNSDSNAKATAVWLKRQRE